ncbi:uncharacterized protein LOC128550911 [Mercenaria mercenaria]|uniref:uncharacterized protein LOC128550911 n=1 Tax=Mercenaria mercenaria TaxID=6596 RepID=UPI00234F26A2|nr:uncharacterized protein LOC128550911 [Mercenaria mercenaria]
MNTPLTVAFLTDVTTIRDECYSISCYTEGCLSDAISEGNAKLCPVPLNGECMTTKTNEMYITSCSQGPCHAVQIEASKIECCTGNLCNLPTTTCTKLYKHNFMNSFSIHLLA